MNITVFALLIMTCSFIAFIFSFIISLVSGSNKALSVCLILFLLHHPDTKGIYSILLMKILLSACIVPISSLSTSTNHFLISLDIVFFFSILILISLHNLKLQKNFL